MRCDLRVFARDYRWSRSVRMIIGENKEIDKDNDDSHVFERDDRHHGNNNHSLSDVSKRNFSRIRNENDDWYFLHWNNQLSRGENKNKRECIDRFHHIHYSIA